MILCGFSPVHLMQLVNPSGQCIGLTTMRERTRLLVGEYTLKSKPDFGTTVRFIFPFLKLFIPRFIYSVSPCILLVDVSLFGELW
jgi:signal transduction histidine kinase